MRIKIENEQNRLAKVRKTLVLAITGLTIVIGLAGCQQEGPAEKAGKNLDRSIENAEQKIEETQEKAEKKLMTQKNRSAIKLKQAISTSMIP